MPLTGILIFLSVASSSALELELGIGRSRQPFYINIDPVKFPDQYENRTIGKLGLSHNFDIIRGVGIKVWAVHYSLFFEKEPSQMPYNTSEGQAQGNGLDILGVSVTYTLF